MKTPALWILAAGVGTLFLVQAGINTHLAALLRDEGLGVVVSGLGLSLSAAFMGAGSLLWGWIAERFPVRYVLVAVSLAVAIPALLFLTVSSTLDALAYSAAFGFGVGGMLSVPPVAYADYYGRRSLGCHPGRYRALHQPGTGHWHRGRRHRLRCYGQLRHRALGFCLPCRVDGSCHPVCQASGAATGRGRVEADAGFPSTTVRRGGIILPVHCPAQY